MISGLVPFEEIIESVKDDTGIENLRPWYEKISRLLFRAEREIGYGGSVVLKKVIYKNPSNYNGKYFAYPVDFIELEGIGSSCRPICQSQYNKTADGIRFTTTQTKDIVLLYWGIFCDGYGRPVTTRNHQEAVVSYIVWKLYSAKIFLGIGNMNANSYYKDEFTMALLEARGDDAFPTLEEWNEIGLLSYSDRRPLIMHPTAGYDYCSDNIKTECEVIEPTTMKVYYWQIDGVGVDFDSERLNIDNDYLSKKPVVDIIVFEQGKIVNYTLIGRLCFAIQETENSNFVITDSLNNDVTDEFDVMYYAPIKTALFVSKNPYSYSSIYFKFKKTINNV